MTTTIGDRFAGDQSHLLKTLLANFGRNLRVAMPGVVNSFDPVAQTAVIQPLIQEEIRDNSTLNTYWTNLPLLLDCPVAFPRGGGFSFTLPLQPGDEGLVVFADMCIDQWFSNAGSPAAPQPQAEKRRHDLSDGIFFPGIYNQSRTLPNFSTTAMQLRNDAGTTYISLSNGEIDLVATTIKKNGVPL